MLFNSPAYLFLFLPIVVAVYHLLNRKELIFEGKVWLVFTSLFFYGYWNQAYLILIITSILINFSIGRALHRSKSDHLALLAVSIPRRVILIAGIVFNLSLLGFFKYTDFIITNINVVTGTQIDLLNLILPLAISFFTFQQIAYLVDSYLTDTQEYDFLNYCLFVTFFPQLIAGPIVHHKEMMPQFMNRENAIINYRNIAMGLFIITIGLVKKIYIADSFAIWANTGFDGNQTLQFYQAWSSSLSYTFQLYYDFSGYTDMAIGAALMFNIRLPINFNSPYKALNIRDFWHRWHITLSRWLRDYVYIPLGGNKHGQSLTLINLSITFLLGGLWHGAGWTFIIWGALHGTAICIHRIWVQLGLKMHYLLGWFLTFNFLNISWVFFRAEDYDKAIRMLEGMTGLNGFETAMPGAGMLDSSVQYLTSLYHGFVQQHYLLMPFDINFIAILFGLFALVLPNSLQISGYLPYAGRIIFAKSWLVLTLISITLSFALFRLMSSHPSEFVYFNF